MSKRAFAKEDLDFPINVVVLKHTANAVRIFDGTRKVWVPKSLVQNLDEIGPEDWAGPMRLPQWFLEKEALV